MTVPHLPEQPEAGQHAASRSLFRGLIDYAGLFPPSQLPLDEAIRNFARYREENDRWMLSRFIIPAGKLEELDGYSDELFTRRPPFRFSVIVPGTSSFDSFLASFRGNLRRIQQFERRHGDRVRVEMLETKLPIDEASAENPETLLPFFESLERAVLDEIGRSLPLFAEVPWGGDYDVAFEHVSTAIGWYNGQPEGRRIQVGFKLRCGGVEPADVPEPEVVASAIFHTLRAKIPFKATAGLHHPVRHYRDEFGGMMHGFLNVFGAGVLGRVHRLDRDELLEIVREDDPRAFKLTERSFSWRALSASIDDVERARAENFISYGSCSFDDPREDLVRLKLLH
ncbi:MAG: hypothetical protein MAG453_02115 [Calditrichaeota bacterium]|nr:hypothetical protein [Calditrichota bacterium]